MRLLVISDTHVPDFARSLPAEILREASTSDLILHAGDVTGTEVLDLLSTCAPVAVARGNGDGPEVAAWGALHEVHLDVGGTPVAIVHDAGPAKGRPARLRRRFPDARLVIYGHSHIPMHVEHEGVHLLNPGSPTWKRRQPLPTFAVVTIGKRGIHVEIESIPPSP